jgi:hypothetical protein
MKGTNGGCIHKERFAVLKLTFSLFNVNHKLMFTTQRSVPTYFFGTDPHTLPKTLKFVPFLQQHFSSFSTFLQFGKLSFHIGLSHKVTVTPWRVLQQTPSHGSHPQTWIPSWYRVSNRWRNFFIKTFSHNRNLTIRRWNWCSCIL